MPILMPIEPIHPKTLIADLYINVACNFKCSYCYLKHYNKPHNKALSEDKIDFIIKALEKYKGNVHLCVLGGEPTRASTFNFTLEKALAAKNITAIDVFTNGTTPLKEIDGVRYIVSIHLEQFKEKYFENFASIKNKIVKIMLLPEYYNRAEELISAAKQYNITLVPDYIHKHDDFFLSSKKLSIEDTPSHLFNNKKVSFRQIIEEDLWDATHFKCYQNEVSINTDGLIEPFCSKVKSDIFTNPDFFKSYDIVLRPCAFKRKCGCFEQVKI